MAGAIWHRWSQTPATWGRWATYVAIYVEVVSTNLVPPAARGRPVATTHAAIEHAAFQLFARKGFASTTLQEIATEVGVGRRTLFRYYASKNDIPWGQFASTLTTFRAALEDADPDRPVWEAVHQGVLQFNTFPAAAQPTHRERMRLLLTTPELQAHAVHQHAAWRGVIESFVADRLGCDPAGTLPRMAGHVSLALALTAYDGWLRDPAADLLTELDRAMRELRSYLR